MANSVAVTTNGIPIDASVRHVDGDVWDFIIYPGMALIDESGLIRFFSVDWEKSGHQGYQLIPYQRTDKVMVAITDFLGSMATAMLISKVAGKNALGARYVFDRIGGPKFIHDFASGLFSSPAGYYNVASQRLTFEDKLWVKRW